MDQFVSCDAGIIRAEYLSVKNCPISSAVARTACPSQVRAEICGGKHIRPSLAVRIARCEALERYHLVHPVVSETFVHAKYAELGDLAIDPRSLFLLPATSDVCFTPLNWTWMYRPFSGEWYLAPAQAIWFHTSRRAERRYIDNTTSGCALGTALEEAALFAILELVERDAYLVAWYLRRPCQQIGHASIKSLQFQLLWARAQSSFPNYSIHLFDIGTEIRIPAVAAIAVRRSGSGPRTIHAAAARPLAEDALIKALQDLMVELGNGGQPREHSYLRRELLQSAALIRGPEDHRDLYYLDETFDRLEFFSFDSEVRIDVAGLNARSCVSEQDCSNLRCVFQSIVRELEAAGIKTFIKDISHDPIANSGLHCVRVLMPGVYPLWFGDRRPFAITPRLQKLARELAGRDIGDASDVNLDFHPFS